MDNGLKGKHARTSNASIDPAHVGVDILHDWFLERADYFCRWADEGQDHSASLNSVLRTFNL